jgi:hypothetical protein
MKYFRSEACSPSGRALQAGVLSKRACSPGRGVPPRAGRPFQREAPPPGEASFQDEEASPRAPLSAKEALPRSLSFLLIAALAQRWRVPAGRLGVRRPGFHSSSARERPVLPVVGSAWDGAAAMPSMPALPRKGRLPPPVRPPFPCACPPFPRVHLPARVPPSCARPPARGGLLERRIPDGAVAAVTRGWGQPLSWDSRGRYDSDHFDVRRLIY